MNDTLYIPKKIKVGFNERNDTYTKKLGFVIYWDDKGVLRQETSWEGWRNKKIDPLMVDNTPTEGFVLNKGVGGTRESYGWNVRNEYVRVYDPRGFEFEISVANLLFILQECTSTKGKGLEGEFIYSWSGKNLVLLPVNSHEYKKSTEFTSNLKTKVDKSMMVPGKTYLFKDTTTAMYLGRHEVNMSSYGNEKIYREKKHVFLNDNYGGGDLLNHLIYEKGFTRLSKIVTEEISDSYSDYLEKFIESEHHQDIKEIVVLEVKTPKIPDDINWKNRDLNNCLSKIDNKTYVTLNIDEKYNSNTLRKYRLQKNYFYEIDGKTIKKNWSGYSNNRSYLIDPYSHQELYYTIDEIKEKVREMTLYRMYYVFENDKKVDYMKLNLNRF